MQPLDGVALELHQGTLRQCPKKRHPAEIVGNLSDPAVWAVAGGRVVGIFCYRRLPRTLGMRSRGTWVSKPWRRRGIALSMWNAVIQRVQPMRVEVITVSRYGHTLVRALAERHPGILFAEERRVALGDLRAGGKGCAA